MADFLQKDILELRVGNIEQIQTPSPLGTCCKVGSCLVDTHSKRWEDYARHFVSYHKKVRQKPRSSVCERAFHNLRKHYDRLSVYGRKALLIHHLVKSRIFINRKGIPFPDQTKPLLWTGRCHMPRSMKEHVRRKSVIRLFLLINP